MREAFFELVERYCDGLTPDSPPMPDAPARMMAVLEGGDEDDEIKACVDETVARIEAVCRPIIDGARGSAAN